MLSSYNPLIAYLIDKGSNPYEDGGVKKEMLEPYDSLCDRIRAYRGESVKENMED